MPTDRNSLGRSGGTSGRVVVEVHDFSEPPRLTVRPGVRGLLDVPELDTRWSPSGRPSLHSTPAGPASRDCLLNARPAEALIARCKDRRRRRTQPGAGRGPDGRRRTTTRDRAWKAECGRRMCRGNTMPGDGSARSREQSAAPWARAPVESRHSGEGLRPRPLPGSESCPCGWRSGRKRPVRRGGRGSCGESVGRLRLRAAHTRGPWPVGERQ